MPPRPEKPKGLNTPGLNWRPRAKGWVAYWVARSDLVERGYSLKSVWLWPPYGSTERPEPAPDEWKMIASNCERLQGEMLEWANVATANWDPRKIYDGTFGSAIEVYKRDPDSPFNNLRYRAKLRTESVLKSLTESVGGAHISQLTFRDFKRWYEGFCKPKIEGQPKRIARGHSMMTYVRIVISFGKLVGLSGCKEARETLSAQTFQMPKRRTTFITAQQATDIRAEAHRRGLPSVAMVQALMFELMIRQKDAIGEMIPASEPGISDVTHHGKKWLYGIRWSEISDDMILTHRLSKSLRGREAVLDPTAGKTEAFDLKAYPMVMEEMQHTQHRAGPLVICERTGRPWDHKYFATVWRQIANAVGVPSNVQNRDSRAGGVTEALDAKATPDQVRRHAGHSQIGTTMGYSRNSLEAKNNVQELRVKTRPKA